MVKHHQRKPAPDNDEIHGRLDLVHHQLPFLQIQDIDVRLVLRNIQIILQRKLGECMNPGPVHMYISL